jgi:hypothetical protein
MSDHEEMDCPLCMDPLDATDQVSARRPGPTVCGTTPAVCPAAVLVLCTEQLHDPATRLGFVFIVVLSAW